jgi:hypothetical protein
MEDPKRKQNTAQVKSFQKTARELECDESEAAFDKALAKIGKMTPRPTKPKAKTC